MNSSKSKVRSPYLFYAKHFNDNYLNFGHNYRKDLYKSMSSPALWGNTKNAQLIKLLESMMIFLIEEVKTIKKTFSIAHDKNTTNIK